VVNWVKHNWGILLVLFSLVALNVVNEARWRADDKADNRFDVASCERANTRSGIEAAYQLSTAELLERFEIKGVPDNHRAFARGTILRMAAPEGINTLQDRLRLVEIEVEGFGEGRHYKLTDAAVDLIHKGCTEAFG
jgi:hypothetical protein